MLPELSVLGVTFLDGSSSCAEVPGIDEVTSQ